MLINSWSAALMVCGGGALILLLIAAFPAFRVVLHWEPGSDSAAQIRLEQQTWLASMLVQYGMMLQIFSLIILVLAAESFAGLLTGAMCAAGTFAANGFGLPTLYVKLVSVFLYGFWLVIHHLDRQSEEMVLTRTKFLFLLFLLPVTWGDVGLTMSFLLGLEPDVITSCCGVIYDQPVKAGWSLIGDSEGAGIAVVFYLVAAALLTTAGLLLFLERSLTVGWRRCLRCLLGLSAGAFGVIALIAVTQFFSPYIYAMPSHRCPFDILQSSYWGLGFIVYPILLGGVFAFLVATVLPFFGKRYGLAAAARLMARRGLRCGAGLVAGFIMVVSFFPLRYLLGGGEW